MVIQATRLWISLLCISTFNSLLMRAGLNDTQVSVVQYGDTNTADLTWKDEQSKSHLLERVESITTRTTAAPALGSGYMMCAHTH